MYVIEVCWIRGVNGKGAQVRKILADRSDQCEGSFVLHSSTCRREMINLIQMKWCASIFERTKRAKFKISPITWQTDNLTGGSRSTVWRSIVLAGEIWQTKNSIIIFTARSRTGVLCEDSRDFSDSRHCNFFGTNFLTKTFSKVALPIFIKLTARLTRLRDYCTVALVISFTQTNECLGT